jgi:Fe-Mn family superoxide dismutase
MNKNTISRRNFLMRMGIVGAGATLGMSLGAKPGRVLAQGQDMAAAYELPPLPYGFDALEPHIDKLTMELHHGKHHNAFITNLKALFEKNPDLATKSPTELITTLGLLPDAVRNTVRNNVGGHLNHSQFWTAMAPNAGGEPGGELGLVLTSVFGSFDNFKTAFTAAAMGRFGSGWAWLIRDKDGRAQIINTPYQDNPMIDGFTPLLGLDVWEHAYYLKYMNRRNEYVAAWWNLVNWPEIENRYATTK